MDESYKLLVALTDQGERLDTWIHHHLPHLSRTRIQALMENNHVQVNGAACQPSQKVKPLDCITLSVPAPIQAVPIAQKIPLDIVFEDEDVLILNKPAGLVVHPAPGHGEGTLVNALLAHCPDSLSGIGGVKRPGIVHRLDKGTSGLMVVAKNDFTHQALTLQFADRTLSRCYQALVGGTPKPSTGCITTLIGRHPHNRQKMAVVQRNGKEAITYYKVEKTFRAHACLVTCQLKTGRTHQIRVHLNHLGHGIMGDPLYGHSLKNLPFNIKKTIDVLKEQERPLLHAYALRFFHPRLEKELTFTSPLPPDFLSVLALFESL